MPAITKLSWLLESNFAALSSGSGRPATSALTFTQAEFESVEFTVAPVASARTPTSCSTAQAPDTQGQHVDGSGDQLALRRGTLTVKQIVENIGASSDAITDLSCFQGAATLLVDEGAPPATDDEMTTGVSATRVTPANVGRWEHGLLFSCEHAGSGRYQTARISGTSTGTKIFSPALLAQPANGSTARFMRQLYAKRTWSTSTLAWRLEGIGFRLTALGCAASEVTWERMTTGQVMQTTVFQVAHWEDDHASADPSCDNLDCARGRVDVNALNVSCPISTLYCGQGGTLTEPAESARTALQIERWTVKVAVNTTPKECPDNAIGMVGWRRSGEAAWTVDIPMCTAQASFFANDRENKARRQLHLDAGPFGAGNGFTIAFGGVWLATDPQVYERGEDEWRQKLQFKVGDYCGDSESAPAAAGVDAYAIVGWGC